MLYEIICDKFKEKRVEFHNGLNTVLGTDSGDNSIGKSTFLMIVDFVFGGSTYTKSADIIRNVGHHDIKFSFIFEKKQYWFIRNTLESNDLWYCDNSYKKIKSISLDQYCAWLKKEYGLSLPFLSFRDVVGRYIRVYGKENLNEKFPLHVVKDEKAKKASYALLKLFDLYTPIHELTGVYERSMDELNVYKKAQKYKFISNITKASKEKPKRYKSTN
ncbi:AAA family ATPase [Pelotomaculum propionicicum]|uniref:AAA family ATPase n=1 Tax=Pelotomaculum propionicicum TaxID=258475 RepID=UPI003B80B4A3